jgi:hypothetical protein
VEAARGSAHPGAQVRCGRPRGWTSGAEAAWLGYAAQSHAAGHAGDAWEVRQGARGASWWIFTALIGAGGRRSSMQRQEGQEPSDPLFDRLIPGTSG